MYKEIDVDFIEFYVKKKYNQNLDKYFEVSRPALSVWRKNGIPQIRVDEFMRREKSFDIIELFSRIYKRES
jgi:hypothetical protein